MVKPDGKQQKNFKNRFLLLNVIQRTNSELYFLPNTYTSKNQT